MNTHIPPSPQNHPTLLQTNHNRIYVVQFLFTTTSTKKKLHTSTNTAYSFWMQKHQQKLSLYQVPFIFHEYLTPQGMKFTLILTIILKKILPVLISIIKNHDIFLHFNVRAPLLPRLLLQHIHQYLLNKTQQIKNIQIHNFFKNTISFIHRIPINSKQFNSFFFWEV